MARSIGYIIPPSHVYLAKMPNGLYKIGCSNDPRGRVRVLQAQLIHAIKSSDARSLERAIHFFLDEFRVPGSREIFKLGAKEIKGFRDWADRDIKKWKETIPTKSLTVRVTPDFRRRVRIKAAKRSLSVPEAILEALKLWLATEGPPSDTPLDSAPVAEESVGV